MESDKRSFTIVSAEVAQPANSRYISKTPYRAAGKATRILFRNAPKGKHQIRFTLEETTRGSAGKRYTYIGAREELKEPQQIARGDRTITINYVYSVKACGEH